LGDLAKPTRFQEITEVMRQPYFEKDKEEEIKEATSTEEGNEFKK